jgi:formiminotetrahydrofolate cyclodeaminase
MDDFTALPIDDFLDQVAGRTPTPGGGSVTAAAGALSCALARMVAAYSVPKKADLPVRPQVESAADRCDHADKLLRGLIIQDAEAYERMTTAAKAAREDASARAAHQEAVLAAISVPMEMAALASDVLIIMDEFKAAASWYLLSDLGVAAVLAQATARAAWYSVRVNVRELTDTTLRTRVMADIDQTVDRCAPPTESIESFVRVHLEGKASPSR